jgi:hypothetical protein
LELLAMALPAWLAVGPVRLLAWLVVVPVGLMRRTSVKKLLGQLQLFRRTTAEPVNFSAVALNKLVLLTEEGFQKNNRLGRLVNAGDGIERDRESPCQEI